MSEEDLAQVASNGGDVLGAVADSKGTRKTFHDEQPKTRKRKHKLNEDTLAIQARHVAQGKKSIAEIAFLMANEEFENLALIGEAEGHTTREYNEAFYRANAAVKTALPYFATSLKADSVKEVDEELSPQDVENALANLLARRK